MVPSPPLPASAASLLELCKHQVTGVLRLRSLLADDLDLYYMGGELISACGLGDDWMFGRLAFRVGAVEAEGLEVAAAQAHEMALPDALVQSENLSIDRLRQLQSECFHENVVRAVVTTWDSADFAAEEAVFPPNMQLGFDTRAFLDRTRAWFEAVWPLLALVDRGSDPRLAWTGGDAPEAGDGLDLRQLLQEPTRLSEVLAASPVVPYRTLAAVAEDIASGTVTVDGQRLPGEELASVTGELEALESREIPVDGDAIDTLPLEQTAAVESLSLEAIGDIGDEEASEGRTAEGDIDYEHVDAGGHVKIYDVLDKVDLSHVEEFPDAGVLAAIGAENDDDLEIAGAETTLEIEGSAEDDFLSSADPEVEGVDAEDIGEIEADPEVDTDNSDETPPIQLSGTEDSIEMEFEMEDDEDEPPEPPPGEDPGPSLAEKLPAVGFETAALDDFDRRIQVFNRIFRVVFETFARSIGRDQTRARFDSFLRDDSLQFPTLFVDMHVHEDGTLGAADLVRNLAAHHPSASESFLHQGLYELIYVHLYDAKDVLAPDDEREMMDQIAAYEEELHRR